MTRLNWLLMYSRTQRAREKKESIMMTASINVCGLTKAQYTPNVWVYAMGNLTIFDSVPGFVCLWSLSDLSTPRLMGSRIEAKWRNTLLIICMEPSKTKQLYIHVICSANSPSWTGHNNVSHILPSSNILIDIALNTYVLFFHTG